MYLIYESGAYSKMCKFPSVTSNNIKLYNIHACTMN